MTSRDRTKEKAELTEEQVVQALTAEERAFLKRVLEIERAKLHVSAYNATDDLLAAVKEIMP